MLLVHLPLPFLQPAPAESLSWEAWICLSLKFFINKPAGMNGGVKRKERRGEVREKTSAQRTKSDH